MTFKYSICHPDKEEIEYRNQPISKEEVLRIAESYPWIEQLELCERLDPKNIYYSPSLDFVCLENQRGFCLTADFDKNKNLKFSLWYNRPKEVKVLFGILGKTIKMTVDDKWDFSLIESLIYLEHFVNGNYLPVDKLFES